MKKALLIPFAVSLAFSLFTGTALAAGGYRFTAVTDDSYDSLVIAELLPVNVIQSPDKLEIRKIYEVGPKVSPDRLPHDTFESGGYVYKCNDILREAILYEEQKSMSMTINEESEKNDVNSVLALLPQFRHEEDESGYSGVLTLNMASIKSEISCYGIISIPYSVTRTYPNLCFMDTRCIPNTVEDDGCMLTLRNIQWSDNTVINESAGIFGGYTAHALYNGTKTSSYIKSYAITAEYTGEVSRKNIDKIRYTVIFTGSLLPESSLSTAQSSQENASDDTETASVKERNEKSGWFYLSMILSILALLVSGASLFLTIRGKGWKNIF